MEEKIATLEKNVEQLTSALDIKLKETESRAEFCRDKMIFNFKEQLAMERKQNSRLEHAIGKIKGNVQYAKYI